MVQSLNFRRAFSIGKHNCVLIIESKRNAGEHFSEPAWQSRSLTRPLTGVRRLAGVAARRLSAALARESELADRVNFVYQQLLGRPADRDGLRSCIGALRNGMSFSHLVQEIKASREVEQYRTVFINAICQHLLGRPATLSELPHYLFALNGGMSFPSLVREIEASAAAEQRRQDSQRDLTVFIDAVYRLFLGRPPEPDGLRGWTSALQNGTSFSHFAELVEASPEAAQRRHRSLDALPDGELILNVYEVFENRGALPYEIEHWRKLLADDRTKRHEFIDTFFNTYIARRRLDAEAPSRPAQLLTLIMGTDRYLTSSAWEERVLQLNVAAPRGKMTTPIKARRAFKHSGHYVVSAIASLYKGRQFLRRFLDNITTQTIFDRSELIIIDADSPQGEEEIIAEYQKEYPNIVYKRMNYCIGIYDAWNLAAQMSRGRYLTSTNVDDLRRGDSFELQVRALDQDVSADVVYQDFFYSCDASLSFDQIARIGFKSELPIITKQNLMAFNSPHNAPMWRKSLHDCVGLFDTSFKSAGDWEFWLRCLWKGKGFCKINTPHVAYFVNPEGISTNQNTRGIDEARRVSLRYNRKLISPYVLAAREGFAEAIGIIEGCDCNLPYYDVVQIHLKRLGDLRRSGADLSNLDEVWNRLLKDAFGPPFIPGANLNLQNTFPVQVTTPAQPWTYAVLFAPQMKDLKGPLVVRVRVSVHGGPIGIGILNRQGSDFVSRTSVVASDDTTVTLRLPKAQPIGDLVIQTWEEGNPADVRVDAITVLGPRSSGGEQQ
jgi:glycosyltransferase involved in cell wall biosynthesis